MAVIELNVRNFRSLTHADLKLSKGLNCIIGANASGKTSILESIHVLFTGRSFRTANLQQLIKQGEKSFFAVASWEDIHGKHHHSGLERSARKSRYRFDNRDIEIISDLYRLQPIHLIHPETHVLLEQGPKFRRQFLDWGVFHVEQGYLEHWKAYHRVLRQRNALLRNKATRNLVCAWDKPLIDQAKQLSEMRKRYIQAVTPIFDDINKRLLNLPVELSYFPGWDETNPLDGQLKELYETELSRGFTLLGCHRADFYIKFENKPAQTVLSRGQQKLVIAALRLAHHDLLRQQGLDTGIILVDDLPAELDKQKRQNLMDVLAHAESQILITATEPELLMPHVWGDHKMFHVEHGKINEVL